MTATSSAEERFEIRRDSYFEAALPSGEVGLEFTFEMFFADYFGKHDAALREDLSSEGLATLQQASIRERAEREEDRDTFTKLIDFVAEQIGEDHHDAAGTFIAQAFNDLYGRRRERYEQILDGLCIADRAALDHHFFARLTVDMGRVPPLERNWATRFVLDMPAQSPCRIERHSVYMLPHGLPMKKVRCIELEHDTTDVHPGVMKTASMSEYATRGD
ncbi:MAG: hypothetical protein QNJ11_02760 [Woeseiaceae bacterium]|nr:hypothetical protein [Woeseiaceae bacterium]